MTWLLAQIWPFILTAFAALVALFYRNSLKGKEKELKDAKDYIDTRKALDDADIGDDPDVLRDWLRNRDPNQR